MTDIPFRAWRRRGGSAITGTIAGRPRAEIRLDASDSAGGRASASVPVALHGPGDVARLRPSSILATFPRPGQVDVETTYCPWIQFSAADLAWRYSPGPALAGDVVPWLALLVVVDSEAAGEFAWQGSAARVSAKALARHPIDGGAAHVQGVPGADGETCRLLCRSELAENTDYLALVVPVFDAAGRRRWGNGRAATLPVLHSWRFRTGPAGDFATLARALHSADDQEQFGRVHVDLGGGQTVDVRGALTGIDATTDPPPTDDLVQRLTALVSFDPAPAGSLERTPRDDATSAHPPTALPTGTPRDRPRRRLDGPRSTPTRPSVSSPGWVYAPGSIFRTRSRRRPPPASLRPALPTSGWPWWPWAWQRLGRCGAATCPPTATR